MPDDQRDDERIRQLEFIKVAAIVSSLGNNEPGYISKARREALDTDAKNNFKKDFDRNKLQTEQTYLQMQQQIKKGLMGDLLSGKKLVKAEEELVTQNGN